MSTVVRLLINVIAFIDAYKDPFLMINLKNEIHKSDISNKYFKINFMPMNSNKLAELNSTKHYAEHGVTQLSYLGILAVEIY